MFQDKWIYFSALGLFSGILIGFALKIALLIWSNIDLSINSALITGAFWGLIFGLINAALIEVVQLRIVTRKNQNKLIAILSSIFATNFVLVTSIVFFGFLPLPNIYYMFGLAIIVSILATVLIRFVFRSQ